MSGDSARAEAERFYRRVLRVYPAADRAARGEEILDVLLADPASRSRRHRRREAVALVRHGLGLRAHAFSSAPARRGHVGFGLVLVLGIVGLQAILWSGLAAIDSSQPGGRPLTSIVDARWPIHLAWILAAVCAVAGRMRLAGGLTWAGAAGMTGYVLALSAGWPWPPLPADGDAVAGLPGLTPATLGWWILAVGAALCLRTPVSAPPRRARLTATSTALAGLTVLLLVSIVGATVATGALAGDAGLGVRASPLPVALALLTLVLLVRSDRGAALALAAWAAVPLALRLPGDIALPALALLGGFALGLVLTRGRTPQTQVLT